MIGRLRIALAAVMVLAAGNAWALGLGQIQVKSKRNQPLLAEIPIVSTTPGELQALQARLASPETFRRVGLAPPSGVASDLQFSLGSDPRGRPVIRVTTVRPVDQSVLNFLIEVDWGQGRLVREYSALIDVPQTASAAVPTAIEMPATPAPAVVQRPLAAVPAQPLSEPAPVPEPLPASTPMPAPVVAAPVEPAPATGSEAIAPVAASPAPAPTPAPVAARESRSEYGPVKRGESLSAIASQLEIRQSTSLEQTMLALLRANPDAFLDDDIHRLRRGAVLRVPSRAEVAAIDADEASQVVRQQMQQWRQARRAVRQPETRVAPVVAAASPSAPAAAAPAAAPAARPATTAVAAAPRRSEARLEIVPAAAPGKANGTRSGTAAGGEGSMQQQIRQRDEDIAAKAAEIDELKERVAALEKLKDEQQSLISLKDSELAAAQQRLAEARTAAPPVTSPAIAQQATRQPAEAPQASTPPVWWIALGVVAAALLAWLLVGRRNRKATTPVRRLFDSEALASSMVAVAPEAVPGHAEVAVGSADAVVAKADAEAHPMPQAGAEPIADADTAPTWHAAPRVASVSDTDDLPETTPPAGPAPLAAALAGVAAPTSASQRFKLVRAFLDIGDDDSARQLLHELLGDADAGVRTDATRMLRELG